MKYLFYFTFFCTILAFSNCATNYKTFKVSELSFSATEIKDSVVFSFQDKILNKTRNYKFDRKAKDFGYRVVALKITNLTDTVLRLHENYNFYLDSSEIVLLHPGIMKKKIGHFAPGFLLYLALTPLKIFLIYTNETRVIPVGFLLGPLVALGNMAKGATASKELEKHLLENDLTFKSILKGETVYGIISFKNKSDKPVSLRVK